MYSIAEDCVQVDWHQQPSRDVWLPARPGTVTMSTESLVIAACISDTEHRRPGSLFCAPDSATAAAVAAAAGSERHCTEPRFRNQTVVGTRLAAGSAVKQLTAASFTKCAQRLLDERCSGGGCSSLRRLRVAKHSCGISASADVIDGGEFGWRSCESR